MKRLSLSLVVFFATLGFVLAQRTITGKVSDTKGEGIIGANVLAKGTTKGAATDIDGNYRLEVPAGSSTLVISYIGFLTQEIELGASNVVDVALKDNTNVLSDVVVTGTGSPVNKRLLATDVQALTGKSLPPVSTSSLDQALVGKIAGADIRSVNGTPGAKASILLRGINTINRGTTPMYLLDGVEIGATDFNSIDPASIERVEVVQGAAGASIYGAQGANGVIQMFSAKGKEGFKIDFSTSIAQSEYLNIGGVAKADKHGFETDANNNVIGGSKNPLTFNEANGTFSENLIWNSTTKTVQINKPYDKNLKYYDHFAQLLRPAVTRNNSLSISGASGKVDYAITASNNFQESNLVGNGDFTRNNITANLGIEIAKGLTFRSVSRYINTHNTINDRGGNATIYALLNTRPFYDLTKKLPDGNYPAWPGSAVGPNSFNPFFINQYSNKDEKRNDFAQSFNLNFQPTKWLELDAKYGVNYQDQNVVRTYQNQTQNANVEAKGYWWANQKDAPEGEINSERYTTNFSNFMASSIFKFDILKDLKSSTQFTFDYRNKVEKDYNVDVFGLPTYTPFTTQQASSPVIRTDETKPFVTYGFVVNQRLNWGSIAGASGGFRSDYSSAFGGGAKPSTFPFANGFVRLSELDFWKNGSLGGIVDEFKLRGGYGKAGIQPKPFDRYITLNTRNLGNSTGFYFSPKQANPDLEVEISQEIEFGAEINFKLLKGNYLNNLTLSPTYWKRDTKNAIWDVDYSPSTGVGTYKDNSFSLGSQGVQLQLGLQIASTPNFDWNLKTNIGRQSSEITDVQGPPVVLTSAAGSTNYTLEKGLKIGQLFGFLGLHDVNTINPNTITDKNPKGSPFIAADQQKNFEVASNGWVVNKDTKAPYFTEDQFSFGDPNPTFIANFINSISFKKFLTLNFQVDWVQGNHLYNQTKEWMYRDGIHKDYATPFTVNGETGAWSAFYRGVYAERSRNGTKSYFYEDASFVRLRNISLAFDVTKIVKIKGIRSLEVILSGRNLWTKTKYTGFDPEINSSNVYESNSAWDRGTDHSSMPNLKTYQVGLNVGF